MFNCAGVASKLAIARGIDWVVADMQGRSERAVINISFQMKILYPEKDDMCGSNATGWSNCHTAIESTVYSAIQNNIVVVAAAGNGNGNTCSYSAVARMGYGNEAAYPSANRVITVGGTMAVPTAYTDARWTCAAAPEGCQSGWGNTNPGSNYGACVSIYAPAWNLRVAGASGATSYRTSGGASSGTSFATPVVAGAAARLLETNPTLTPAQVWQALRDRADMRGQTVVDFDPSATTNRRLVYLSVQD